MADSPHDSSASDARRYYRSPRDGEVTGPFTRAEIDRAIARGDIHAESLLCVEGSTQWQPASVVLFGMAIADRSTVPPTSAGSNAHPPYGSSSGNFSPSGEPRRVGIAGPIVVTVLSLLLCCLPLGAVALVYAFIANAKFEAGDVEGGMRAERTVRGWMIAMWILLALSCVINGWLSYAMLDAVDEVFNQLTRMR